MSHAGQKQTVDHRVSLDVGLPIAMVALITESFLHHARDVLVEYGELHLKGLGRLRVVVVDAPNASPFLRIRARNSMKEAIKARNKEMPYGKIRSRRVPDA